MVNLCTYIKLFKQVHVYLLINTNSSKYPPYPLNILNAENAFKNYLQKKRFGVKFTGLHIKKDIEIDVDVFNLVDENCLYSKTFFHLINLFTVNISKCMQQNV